MNVLSRHGVHFSLTTLFISVSSVFALHTTLAHFLPHLSACACNWRWSHLPFSPEMTGKGKGKGKEVAGKASAGKRKNTFDDDKTGGRKRNNRGVLQFFDDAAVVDEDDDEDSDDIDSSDGMEPPNQDSFSLFLLCSHILFICCSDDKY